MLLLNHEFITIDYNNNKSFIDFFELLIKLSINIAKSSGVHIRNYSVF